MINTLPILILFFINNKIQPIKIINKQKGSGNNKKEISFFIKNIILNTFAADHPTPSDQYNTGPFDVSLIKTEISTWEG